MQFGLSIETIQRIKNVFKMHPEVERVILYGSRALGTYRNGSDIDLTLKGDKLNFHLLSKIDHEIDDLLMPYKCDLSIFSDIQNQALLDHIKRVGITFYQRA